MMSTDNERDSDLELYVKKVIREMYHDIPTLRPVLLDLNTRRLMLRKLARAMSADVFPVVLAEEVLRVQAAEGEAESESVEDQDQDQDQFPKAATGKEIIISAFNQRGKLLAAYGSVTAQAQGWTDEEAARVAGLPERSCWWKRAGELREAGCIEVMRDADDDVVRRKGQAGVLRQVSVITDYGMRVLQSLEV